MNTRRSLGAYVAGIAPLSPALSTADELIDSLLGGPVLGGGVNDLSAQNTLQHYNSSSILAQAAGQSYAGNIGQAAAQAKYLQWQATQTSVPSCIVMVAQQKITRQIDRMIDALPTRVCQHIDSVRFFPTTPDRNARFYILFTNNKTLEFEDVDEFPTDAQLARIGLDCP
jgi:hypothetical protein